MLSHCGAFAGLLFLCAQNTIEFDYTIDFYKLKWYCYKVLNLLHVNIYIKYQMKTYLLPWRYCNLNKLDYDSFIIFVYLINLESIMSSMSTSSLSSSISLLSLFFGCLLLLLLLYGI